MGVGDHKEFNSVRSFRKHPHRYLAWIYLIGMRSLRGFPRTVNQEFHQGSRKYPQREGKGYEIQDGDVVHFLFNV